MTYRARFALSVLAVAGSMIAVAVEAAPACLAWSAFRVVHFPAQPAQPALSVAFLTTACNEDCVADASGELAEDLPAPTHLPLVSSPDEVASWHAEIFERLSDIRDEPPRYCALFR